MKNPPTTRPFVKILWPLFSCSSLQGAVTWWIAKHLSSMHIGCGCRVPYDKCRRCRCGEIEGFLSRWYIMARILALLHMHCIGPTAYINSSCHCTWSWGAAFPNAICSRPVRAICWQTILLQTDVANFHRSSLFGYVELSTWWMYCAAPSHACICPRLLATRLVYNYTVG